MFKSANPFAEMDFTKVMSEFKVPGFNVEALVNTQRKNFEAIAAANQLAIEGFQAVAKRQGDIVRETIETLTKAGQELASASQSPDVRVAKQAELAKAGYEKALANLRELSEMMVKSNSEAFGIINKRVTEALDEMKHSVVNGKANGKHR
ncbi:MAG: phasin family protein [Alphaproteobacteria bacterium]|nr:phasin family protein [Alphaproteobacteria bacterium]